MRFVGPSTSRDVSSDSYRAYLPRLCSAFRFSQPLDALLRSRPPSLVSCWFRPWALHLQRFSPRGSRRGPLDPACPSCPLSVVRPALPVPCTAEATRSRWERACSTQSHDTRRSGYAPCAAQQITDAEAPAALPSAHIRANVASRDTRRRAAEAVHCRRCRALHGASRRKAVSLTKQTAALTREPPHGPSPKRWRHGPPPKRLSIIRSPKRPDMDDPAWSSRSQRTEARSRDRHAPCSYRACKHSRRGRDSARRERRNVRAAEVRTEPVIGLQGIEPTRDPYPTRALLGALAGRSSLGLDPLQGVLLTVSMPCKDNISSHGLCCACQPEGRHTHWLSRVLKSCEVDASPKRCANPREVCALLPCSP